MKYLKQFEKFSNPFKKKVSSKSDQLIDIRQCQKRGSRIFK